MEINTFKVFGVPQGWTQSLTQDFLKNECNESIKKYTELIGAKGLLSQAQGSAKFTRQIRKSLIKD